ncbi:MAG TPA: fibronectin type III domain-containing protein [Steroidobacteraceae bacterium]|nr:fibronectin type III domain-containing protein [Steroidobacteraceae bacterium]
MRHLNSICGLAASIVLLSGCGGGSSGSSVSSTPPASTGSATLTWNAPTANTNGSALNDLAGYHVHWGASASSLTQTVDVPSASTTTYVVSGLSAGTWYFGVTAYTNTGLESALSNVGSKTIP